MLATILFACLSNLLVSNTHQIKLNVTGLKSNNGMVMVQLMDEQKKVVKQLAITIQNLRAEYVFADIPSGKYSIRLFHDENNNRKMDTNLMGIPKEGYGFSNNAKGTFGPPAYEKTLFDCDTNKTLEIQLTY